MEPAVYVLFNAYGYNARSELISFARTGGSPSLATEHEYAYDPIGNRTSSSDLGTTRAYTANSLNQYTEISTLRVSAPPREIFTPQFDDDGNQTLIRTKTGIWSVTYNGENRPVFWSCGETNIVMSFDRMGRRVSYTETVGVTTNAHRTFVYDNYLQIADNSGSRYVWDPTEPVATRPLAWLHGGGAYYYTHDGNKNVSELVDDDGIVTAHYEYAPFGDVTVAAGDLAFDNPFRFSSEYSDDTLGLVYYNYRHYDPVTGRWIRRDPIEDDNGIGAYLFCYNFKFLFDVLGTSPKAQPIGTSPTVNEKGVLWFAVAFDGVDLNKTLYVVKHIKIDLRDCESGKQLLYDGKEWIEEVSLSRIYSNVRFVMLDGNKPMSSLVQISPPGEKNCRYGKIEFSSDFFLNKSPHFSPKGKQFSSDTNPKSWFTYFGDDATGNHRGSVSNYQGGMPPKYSNSNAFATLNMEAVYSCGKEMPSMTVHANGDWIPYGTQRLNDNNELRGPTGSSDADWWINGTKFVFGE
ncbi:MAG: RHS repeat-associated core domain-containing protein [Kiritimatiellae bacterium]|nr:RHS repeat-associated core domain-containing protein [Kiritimatiellia bacterium]